MVFSSSSFLFFFLPITLILYYLVKKNRTAGNAVLAVMSLLFYAWGEPKFVLVMVGSIILNWLIARGIDASAGRKKLLLTLGIILNVCILGVFKYTSFAIRNVNSLFKTSIVDPKIALPIGISFFTFQAMSYIIDVYRGRGKAQKHLLGVCLYISFFPQLIAGPIVRYETVAEELTGRRETIEDFSEGARRFLVGLSKKAILANALAALTDSIYALPASSMTVALSWLSAVSYLMQVYYDFSGYSDMAIGLGRMFGFHFLENFNLPFIAKSVTEFWRRWHISMCSWFRDYVFFPLGGSRVKTGRMLFNMFVVWALTGLWHGAEWTFVLWGLGFFVVLAIEKLTGLGKWMEKHAVGHFYAMALTVIVTVMIRCDNLTHAGTMYSAMFGLSGAPLSSGLTGVYLREYAWCLIAGVICSLPVWGWLKKKLHIGEKLGSVLEGVALAAVSVIAVSFVVSGGYNPFIYFNF